MLAVLVTPSFARVFKKLHAKDRIVVDQAVKTIAANPFIGEEKKGDLAGVFVHKFKINQQEVLLAYQLSPDKLVPESVLLLSIGSHENFYSGIKRKR